MSKSNTGRMQKMWEVLKFPLLAIAMSFFVGSLFIIWTGNNPLVAYGALLDGSLGAMNKFGETLLKTTPLIFTGLSVAFAFRTGLFNIGGEGQYFMGALFTISAAWIFQGLPGFILIPIMMIAGAVGGAIWAFIPGFLKAKLGIHEVIVCIMLNYAAMFFTAFIVRTALNPSTLLGHEQKAHSVVLNDFAQQAKLTQLNEIAPIFGTSSVHTGLFIAIVSAIVAYYLLFKTTLGYEIRSVGNNPTGAEYGGINISKNVIMSMMISGLFAGLAGATTVAGLTYKLDQPAGFSGYGFTGIAVSLVGNNHPLGVVASAFLFGVLANGSRKMQIAGIPKEIVSIVQALIIIFIAAEAILKYWPTWKEKLFGKKNKAKEAA